MADNLKPVPGLPDKFLKPYDSVGTEDRVYEAWEKSGFFNPDNLKLPSDAKPFSMVLPPPNVTGQLHMGSAMMLAIEDVLTRYKRLRGYRALWLPGTDHAAIATQVVVEKKIQKEEGKSRYDLGREELLRRIGTHVSETHDVIIKQMRKMGASLDWSREAFTLDEPRNLAVRTAFKRMYDDGLIYRGYRVVNCDPKGQTTISDDEIEYETRKTKLYTFKYAAHIPISISTTRPETKLGDTAIAVHPDDPRYQALIGQEFEATFAGEPIKLKVIADQAVEKDFGTGALGVTPAHSMIDWEMAERHHLPLKPVINEYGKMIVGQEGVRDKKTAEAREAVVVWLKENGLLEKEEEIEHNVSLAQRTGGLIEPLPKLQWFVAVNKPFKIKHSTMPGLAAGAETTLKEMMKKAVESGGINIIPDRFQKIYFNWIENLRDWCISRQIWYGHRVPVWYRGQEVSCGLKAPEGADWKQDEDTLDTWFSSGLWTFSTLGWPDEAAFEKMRQYHPTTVLETGSDLIFFWVARMILMTTYLLGEVPFRTVYMHGLVRDNKGRKISKSLGNNIDPLDMIAKYGADAVRMSLIVGVGPGSESKIDEQKIKAYKLFANKLWNITRFILTNTADFKKAQSPVIDWRNIENQEVYPSRDKHLAWLQEFEGTLRDITTDMENFRFYLAAEKLYHYAWHTLADKILEESKPMFSSNNPLEKAATQDLLLSILTKLTIALHPFMPFITEEIWSALPESNQKLLLVEQWPC